ncbi:poly(glycerol-phosphate) alpha-glucosyltransferase [Lactiplantibacillus plantarum]|nr:poly(glycerol-phosphate) alpha-glucosyltransferase [Lactiplantibacillus plantarum]MCG0614635.1 poly(glycerol-phosphate) alpha-glucosyltransferase [Lactiplantibacillus plantarum]MCG0710431.1 poly(glycerol-phosphate) alpha-glucosyltransferase [Lactiplantibacillus plantarum]
MYYFLNDNMQFSKSGIEQAEINRLTLFKKHHVAAKIVTRVFAMNLHDVLEGANIADADFVNLFDFFCGSQSVKRQRFDLADFEVPADAIKTRKDNQIQVMERGKLIMIIYLRAGTEAVSNVQYFDVNGRTLKMSWWDTRGFKCLEQLFDWDGKIAQEAYFGPDGLIHVEKLHLLNHAGQERITWRVLNYNEQSHTFNGMNELTRYFYDELNQLNDEQNVFICDRTVECAWGLFNMTTPAKKVLHLHNNHVSDAKDIMHSTLNNNYANALNNWAAWDAVISATPEQTKDVEARFGKDIPAFTIPVGYVDNATLKAAPVKFDQRQKDLVVQVARLAPEKQQNHSIEAFVEVHKQFPDAKLELWGYANGDIEKQLHAQVAAAHLEDVVLFKGYTTGVNAVYNRAQLGLLPSRAEGFSLMLLEAQAHGLPMVANDVKYGPSDIIQDHKSGILTTDGDVQQLTKTILELLKNQGQLAQYSAQAYENAKRYSEEAVFKQWQALLDYFKPAKVTA